MTFHPVGVSGQPVAAVQPSDMGLLGWAYDPTGAADGSNIPGSGVVQAVRIKVPACTITNLWMCTNSAGSSLTANQNFAGIYNSAGTTLLGQTADQSTAWTSGFAVIQMALTSTITVPAGFIYFSFYVNNTAGTNPKFQWAGSSAVVNTNLATSAARFATGGSGATTAFPASLTLAKTADAYWCAVS